MTAAAAGGRKAAQRQQQLWLQPGMVAALAETVHAVGATSAAPWQQHGCVVCCCCGGPLCTHACIYLSVTAGVCLRAHPCHNITLADRGSHRPCPIQPRVINVHADCSDRSLARFHHVSQLTCYHPSPCLRCLACLPPHLQDAFILTANISLEYEKAEVNAGFFYSSAEQRESLVAAERAYTDERCRRVIELKKQVRLGSDGACNWQHHVRVCHVECLACGLWIVLPCARRAFKLQSCYCFDLVLSALPAPLQALTMCTAVSPCLLRCVATAARALC
jgi:hypothetical protein